MTKGIRIHETGGPEVLRWEDIEVGSPAAGQVRLKQTACGLNYIDVYGRTGLYPMVDFPAILGMEAAGIVEELGANVDNLVVGDRVAYAMQLGAYTEERLIDARQLVKIPDSISDETAAAIADLTTAIELGEVMRFWSTPQLVESGLSSANGQNYSVPQSSAASVQKKKPNSPGKTAVTTRYFIVMKISPAEFAN